MLVKGAWGDICAWWRHRTETFSTLLALCAGNPPVTGEFPTQRPVTWSFDVSFDLCLNQHLSKQWRCSWCEMPLRSLWRHICNVRAKFNLHHIFVSSWLYAIIASWHGKLSILLALCEGNPLITSGFPSQRASTSSWTNIQFPSDLRCCDIHATLL